jgi:hypothetical protein
MTIDQKIEANYLLGAVRVNGRVMFYMNPIAYWIMDTKSYDPGYDASGSPGPLFRDGVFIVDSHNVNLFLKAIEPDSVSLEDIIGNLPLLGEELNLFFLIDFNSRLFVNGYADIEIEKYIPEDWKGIFDNPLNYLPDDIKAIWA